MAQTLNYDARRLPVFPQTTGCQLAVSHSTEVYMM